MRPVLFRFIGHIARYNTNIGSEHVSHCPEIYCGAGGSCDREGYLWIIRKRLLNY